MNWIFESYPINTTTFGKSWPSCFFPPLRWPSAGKASGAHVEQTDSGKIDGLINKSVKSVKMAIEIVDFPIKNGDFL